MSIYETLAAIQAKVGVIEKGSENRAQGFKFRSIEAVVARLAPLFAEEGLTIRPLDVEVDSTMGKTRKGDPTHRAIVTVTYELAVGSDEADACLGVSVGEGVDPGDKAVAKAMTAAWKTFLVETFMIPTEEDPDFESPDAPEDLGPPVVAHEAEALLAAFDSIDDEEVRKRVKVDWVEHYGVTPDKLPSKLYGEALDSIENLAATWEAKLEGEGYDS